MVRVSTATGAACAVENETLGLPTSGSQRGSWEEMEWTDMPVGKVGRGTIAAPIMDVRSISMIER